MHDDASNRKFWYNKLTGNSVWGMPDELKEHARRKSVELGLGEDAALLDDWVKHHDDGSGHDFYFSASRNETRWAAEHEKILAREKAEREQNEANEKLAEEGKKKAEADAEADAEAEAEAAAEAAKAAKAKEEADRKEKEAAAATKLEALARGHHDRERFLREKAAIAKLEGEEERVA